MPAPPVRRVRRLAGRSFTPSSDDHGIAGSHNGITRSVARLIVTRVAKATRPDPAILSIGGKDTEQAAFFFADVALTLRIAVDRDH